MEPEPELYQDDINNRDIIYKINKCLEESDYETLETMLINGADLNDLDGMRSPLIEFADNQNNPIFLELLLKYGANPNHDNGSGITLFTDMLMNCFILYIGPDNPNFHDYLEECMKILLNNKIEIDFNKSEYGASASDVLDNWVSKYSYYAKVLEFWRPENMRIRRNPRPDSILEKEKQKSIYSRDIMISIIDNILYDKQQFKTMRAKQRSSFAKTGMPSNILNSISSYLDEDVFDKTGRELYESRNDNSDPYVYPDPFYNYNPDEEYDEFLENKYAADWANIYDQYGGKKNKKKLTKKRAKRFNRN
jgi:hypothetical protein